MPDTPPPTTPNTDLPGLVEPEEIAAPIAATEPAGGPLQPATEPLTGQFQEDTANKPIATTAAPLTPASEPLIQTEAVQAPAPAITPAALPALPELPQQFLTGSAIAPPATPKLPKGVYAIVALNGLALIFGAVQQNDTGNIVAGIGHFISLLLAVGLLFRYEAARKAMVIISIILVLLNGFLMFGILGLKAVADQNLNAANTRLQSVLVEKEGQVSLRQRQEWQQQLDRLEADRQKAARAVVVAAVYSGLTAVIYLAQAIYLTRPNVRSVFKPMAAD